MKLSHSLISILVITGILTQGRAAHPLHVSFTSIDLRAGVGEAAVVFKFNTEDFSLLFYHLFEKEVKPMADKDFNEKEAELVERYMTAAFSLSVLGNRQPLSFVKKDQDDQYLWLYYKCNLPVENIKSVHITNRLLLDLYEDQSNLVIVTDGVRDKGHAFNWREMEAEIGLE